MATATTAEQAEEEARSSSTGGRSPQCVHPGLGRATCPATLAWGVTTPGTRPPTAKHRTSRTGVDGRRQNQLSGRREPTAF